MRDSIKSLIIDEKASLRDALKCIDKNKKRFVIVASRDERIVGVMTDGDARRFIINHCDSFDRTLIGEMCSKDYKYLLENQTIKDAIDLFKNDGIIFLPIIDKDNHIINIITKAQLHSLLLRDLQVGLDYDFQQLDEEILNFEIISKPWGFYKTMVFNDYFQSKVLSVYPMEKLSLQVHKQREEYWTIVHGTGEVRVAESVKSVGVGDHIFIPKDCKHSIRNNSSVETLIISEIQIGEYFGEDDIIRLEDAYGRK